MGHHYIGKKDSSAYHTPPVIYSLQLKLRQWRYLSDRNLTFSVPRITDESYIKQHRDIGDMINNPAFMRDFREAWEEAAKQSNHDITRNIVYVDVRKNMEDAHIATMMSNNDSSPTEYRFFSGTFRSSLEHMLNSRNSMTTVVYSGLQDKSAKYGFLDAIRYDPEERTIFGRRISIQLEGFSEQEIREYKPASVTERLGARTSEPKKGSANFNKAIRDICIAGFHPWARKYSEIAERRRKQAHRDISPKLRKIVEGS